MNVFFVKLKEAVTKYNVAPSRHQFQKGSKAASMTALCCLA
jgi:hypothetical protein